MERRFDVCSGRINEDARIIETVTGMGNAYDLMIRMAWEIPGTYFIVCANTNIVCGTIDTSVTQPRPLWCFHDRKDSTVRRCFESASTRDPSISCVRLGPLAPRIRAETGFILGWRFLELTGDSRCYQACVGWSRGATIPCRDSQPAEVRVLLWPFRSGNLT